MKKTLIYILALLAATAFGSCKSTSSTSADGEGADTINVPTFSADSAMASINAQCSFGERLLGSKAHEDCAQYIINAFEAQGCEVTRQDATFQIYDGRKYQGCNIIASINPDADNRIMICSHWDSRPWADHDPNPANHRKPVMAANDGASGIAVMIELARQFKLQRPELGVDFVCFDAEDYGVPEWDETYEGDDEATWCLGARYWAQNPHRTDFRYAILLDMVGGKGAVFHKEQFSTYYAEGVVAQVWEAAAAAGYSSLFPDKKGGAITDDHLPLNQIAGIKAIDIIAYYPNSASAFGPTWHTTNDTPENISLSTLQGVGQTLMQLIYTW